MGCIVSEIPNQIDKPVSRTIEIIPEDETLTSYPFNDLNFVLLPISIQYLIKGSTEVIVPTREVLRNIRRMKYKENMIVYFILSDSPFSSLEPEEAAKAAYAAVCARRPSMKVSRIFSIDEIFQKLSPESRKILRETLEEIELRKCHPEEMQDTIPKFVRHADNPDNAENSPEDELTDKLPMIKLEALIGKKVQPEIESVKHSATVVTSRVSSGTGTTSTQDGIQTVFRTVLNDPPKFLHYLNPLSIAALYHNERMFCHLITECSDEDILKRLLQLSFYNEYTWIRKNILSRLLSLIEETYPFARFIIGFRQKDKNIIFLGYTSKVIQRLFNTFYGVGVEIRNESILYNDSRTQKSSLTDDKPHGRMSASKQQLKNMKHCINYIAPRLWTDHSNLNAITAEVTGKDECDFRIVLICSGKGIIPVDEKPFPTSFPYKDSEILFSVEEGRFSLGHSFGCPIGRNEPLCMGCSIGTERGQSTGSLGLFVEHDGSTKCLTCCHVLFDCTSYQTRFTYQRLRGERPTNVLQPGPRDLFCDKSMREKMFGSVERAVFAPSVNAATNPVVSVDAALVNVKYREPTRGLFVVRDVQQLERAGFDAENPPIFDTGSYVDQLTDSNYDNPVIKAGSSTGLTTGHFCIDGAQVKINPSGTFFNSNTALGSQIMKGQYEVRGFGENFFESGDSGAAVFLKDNDQNLQCLGLAIGQIETSRGRAAIVTPIAAIMKELGLTCDNIKRFDQSSSNN